MNDRGRYRRLYTRLWRHPGFVELTDGEKVLALYVLTGPQTNRIGLYNLSIATAAEDLGTLPETLKKRFVRVSQTFGWPFDNGSRVVFIPSWFKWNPPDGVNVLKGSLKDLNEIPSCGLIDAFARNIETLDPTLHETFLEGLRQRLPKPSRTQDQYQESVSGNQDQEQKRAALRAVALKGKDKSTFEPTPSMLKIAREVLEESPRDATMDYLCDHFLYLCREAKIQCDRREMAVVALAQSRSGLSA